MDALAAAATFEVAARTHSEDCRRSTASHLLEVPRVKYQHFLLFLTRACCKFIFEFPDNSDASISHLHEMSCSIMATLIDNASGRKRRARCSEIRSLPGLTTLKTLKILLYVSLRLRLQP